jgi:resuscitation-promoting factor RpfA
MRPKLVAVALTGGILVLGAGSVVAATRPSWTTHTAGTMTSAASAQRGSAASAAPSAKPLATPSDSPSSLPTMAPSAAPARTATSTAMAASASARAAMPHATGTITYTVKSGDTLSGIAAWFNLHGYGALYAANMAVIGANPDLIIPGERITISKGVLKLSGAGK